MNNQDKYLPRIVEPAVDKALRVSPVVVLLGARQTGKTTLVRGMPRLADRPYLSLDDFDLRTQAEAQPAAFLARAPELVLDEVQRTRDLLASVKQAVDRDRPKHPGRFVLTGSANLLLMEHISETLAGRAVYITLWPMTRGERLGYGMAGPWTDLVRSPFSAWLDIVQSTKLPQSDWRNEARIGGLPVPALTLHNAEERNIWLAGYVQTYLERDLQTIRTVDNLPDFRRLMRASCLRIGTMVNQTELGRDVGISQTQVHRFLNLLETSYQAVRIQAYSVNRTKRLIKSPKLYWSDTGLALFLAGEESPRGEHLENMVLQDLLAWQGSAEHRPEILYWRTADGEEVDFVIETPRRCVPIEVKASTKAHPADAKGLESFLDEYNDRSDGGLLLYAGSEVYPLTPRVLAVPWWKVC